VQAYSVHNPFVHREENIVLPIVQGKTHVAEIRPLLTIHSSLTSAIITICVGPDQRLFAGHEEILSRSTYFQTALKAAFFDSGARRIDLPDESPEVLSAVLEYLYKGDYTPKLIHHKKRDTWEIEDTGSAGEATVMHHRSNAPILKDTAI
jgi:hypothetical protein